MVDETGTMRLPQKYEQIGEFRGDLAKSLCLPEFLPGVKGAKIRKWLKAEGSEVKAGEPLAQVELTEPTLPVEAPVSGMLVKIGVPAKGAAIPGSPIGAVRVLGHVDVFAKKQFDVVCPGYGPNPGSATVVRWLKEEGDAVVKGDKIAEIRPEEAMAAINSPGTGTLVKIEAADGAEVKVGQSVAKMGIGRVPVKLAGEWFYVDERGSRVWSAHYDEVGSMQGGMAPTSLLFHRFSVVSSVMLHMLCGSCPPIEFDDKNTSVKRVIRPNVSRREPDMSRNDRVIDVTRRLGSPRLPEHFRP